MLKILIAATIAMLLTACGGGGGDPEPENEHVPTPGPVNCEIRPDVCK